MAKLSAALETQPSKRNELLVNPEQDIHQFIATERKLSNAAIQKPIFGGIKDIRKKIEILGLPISAVRAIFNPIFPTIGNVIEKSGEFTEKILKMPFDLVKYAATGAIALAGNVPKHILDIGIKLPVSAVTVISSFIGRPLMSLSGWANKLREKDINPFGKIGQITSGIRAKLEKIQIPEIGPATKK